MTGEALHYKKITFKALRAVKRQFIINAKSRRYLLQQLRELGKQEREVFMH